MSFRLLMLILVGLCAGCQGKPRQDSRQPRPESPAKAPDRDASRERDEARWREVVKSFPGSAVSITAFPDANRVGFILAWLRGFPGWPGCVSQHLDRVDRYYMVQTSRPNGTVREDSTLIFYGSFLEDEAAACAERALSAVGRDAPGEWTAKTEEHLTTVRVDGTATAFIHWSGAKDEAVAVVDHEEELVRNFLSTPAKVDPEGPLFALAEGVDHSADVWSVGTGDYGSRLLGVASTGYDVSVRFSGSQGAAEMAISGEARLHFDSDHAAEKARTAFSAFLGDIDHQAARTALEEVLTVKVRERRLALSFRADKEQTMLLMSKLTGYAQSLLNPAGSAP